MLIYELQSFSKKSVAKTRSNLVYLSGAFSHTYSAL